MRVSFVERVEADGEHLEDLDTARVVIAFQAGDSDAFSCLYTRYFERVYGYLRVVLRDIHEAEDAAQQVFMQTFEALPRYERRGQPFRAWLFTIVRNRGISRAEKLGRLDVTDPEQIDRWRDGEAENGDGDLRALDWISDQDLLIFIERLPLAQRQILAMRYLMGLTASEIAEAVGRTPGDVRKLQSRAIGFLRERLTAVGRPVRRRDRAVQRCRKQAPVLRMRRFALTRW
ncbi:MAG: polymerase sigma-70 factor, subfamily [Solirubrobacterales bacterium]|nr:polymerase sigma-70 factor, subfamily [Solirubrobacterales bacterium]